LKRSQIRNLFDINPKALHSTTLFVQGHPPAPENDGGREYGGQRHWHPKTPRLGPQGEDGGHGEKIQVRIDKLSTVCSLLAKERIYLSDSSFFRQTPYTYFYSNCLHQELMLTNRDLNICKQKCWW